MIPLMPIVAALQKDGMNYMVAPPLNVVIGFGTLNVMNVRLNNSLSWLRDFTNSITI